MKSTTILILALMVADTGATPPGQLKQFVAYDCSKPKDKTAVTIPLTTPCALEHDQVKQVEEKQLRSREYCYVKYW